MYMGNGLKHSRFAVCPVKKYGTSVQRNRAKRICRELYRTMKEHIPRGFDIVLVIYPGTDTYSDRENQFVSLLKRADLLDQDTIASSHAQQ